MMTKAHWNVQPTMHSGKCTGYVVAIDSFDICIEVHSGTETQNNILAYRIAAWLNDPEHNVEMETGDDDV